MENKCLPFAIELVSAATVLRESENSKAAAEFIMESGSDAAPAAQKLARTFLGIEDSVSEELNISRHGIILGIKELKARRLSQGRNAFVWADLARLYVLLGQIAPARQAIKVALSLAPHERFVLRSATRFFLHSMDHEQALHLLRSNARTPFDPWLVAAEIAVSSVLEKKPKFARCGQSLLKDADVPLFHTSELASALGSLELFEGHHKKANKLFSASVQEPTENALAQVVWASKRSGLGNVNPDLLNSLHASEAKTFDSHNRADWNSVVSYADEWAHEESFSSRPRQIASSVASSLLNKHELAVEIAQMGLATNPGHPGLLNNKAFALIQLGKPEEGMKAIDMVDKHQLNPIDIICLVATAGLAYFRLGDPIQGRAYYEKAIEAASRQKKDYLKILARLYLARERVLQGELEGLTEFRKAHEAAKKIKTTSLPYVADNLANQVMDAAISKKAIT
jgi:tetratricopeptide (TPR) repeat protein